MAQAVTSQFGAVRCSALQRVAACCSVLLSWRRQLWSAEYRALLIEFRAVLTEHGAFLIEYEALLIECGALLIECGALFIECRDASVTWRRAPSKCYRRSFL